MDEENHVLVHSALIHELNNKSDYLLLFGSEKRFKYILNGLHPLTNCGGIVLVDKWLTLPGMGYIFATFYNGVVVQFVLPENVYARKISQFELNNKRYIVILTLYAFFFFPTGSGTLLFIFVLVRNI